MASEHYFHFKGERELLTKEKTIQLTESLTDEALLKKITHVKLSNKSFDLESAEVIGEKLKGMENVEIADLSDIISGRPEDEALQVLQVITDSLAGKPIVELHLSDNALGKKGVSFCSKLLGSLPKLERLYMNNNGLAPEAVDLLSTLLLNSPPTKLKILHMYNNLLRDEGAIHISNVIANSPDLSDVCISATRFGIQGGGSITTSLSNTVNLISLDLSDNNFGKPDVIKRLVNVLSTQPHLKRLNLRYGELGNDGTTEVLAALTKANIDLEFLDLSGNEITIDIVDDIADYVRKATGLKHFLIEENEIESEGMRTIAMALRDNSNLVEIDFSTNILKSAGAISLANALQGKPHLKHLRLNGNEFSERGLEILNSILEMINLSNVLGDMGENEEIEEEEDDLTFFDSLSPKELVEEFKYIKDADDSETGVVPFFRQLAENASLEASMKKLGVDDK